MKNIFFFLFLFTLTLTCAGQFRIKLYEGEIPGARPDVEEEKHVISSDNDTIVSKVSH